MTELNVIHSGGNSTTRDVSQHGTSAMRLLDGGWLSPLLRLFGLLTPPLFLLFYPWPMAGGEILVAFGGTAFVAGVLLRTWWAGLIVPAMTLSVIVGYALIVRGDVTRADSEFTRGGALLVASVGLFLVALAASLGALVGRRVLTDGERF